MYITMHGSKNVKPGPELAQNCPDHRITGSVIPMIIVLKYQYSVSVWIGFLWLKTLGDLVRLQTQ